MNAKRRKSKGRASSLKTKTIKQVVMFPGATPKQLYEMLMDSKQHAKFTGAKAKISSKVGGTFSAYDGSLMGKNTKLIPGRLIIQAWRSRDWPAGHYSKAMFLFTKTRNGTKLTFGQTGVPISDFQDINSGWKQYYWNPMQRMIQNKTKK